MADKMYEQLKKITDERFLALLGPTPDESLAKLSRSLWKIEYEKKLTPNNFKFL